MLGHVKRFAGGKDRGGARGGGSGDGGKAQKERAAGDRQGTARQSAARDYDRRCSGCESLALCSKRDVVFFWWYLGLRFGLTSRRQGGRTRIKLALKRLHLVPMPEQQV